MALTMLPFKLPPPFDTIDVWDEKYDYVMHDDHWLTSKWSADCEKCRAAGKRPSSPVIKNNVTANNIVKNQLNTTTEPVMVNSNTNNHHHNHNHAQINSNNFGATITKAQQSVKSSSSSSSSSVMPTTTTNTFTSSDNVNTTVDNLTSAVNNINLTSSPVRNSHSMSTIKNDTTRHTNNMDISPPPAVPPPVTIAMTPIAHPSMSTRAFMTPYTSSKFGGGGGGGNETFNRTTRQSAKKLLNQQNANKDLIDLNETFDLYRSCLAETPQLSQQSSPQNDNEMTQHQQQNNHHHQQQNNHHQQQQASSRIPKIPVRMHK